MLARLGTPRPESTCRDGCLVCDFDHDGDLDLFDVDALQTCFGASTGNRAYVSPSAVCSMRFDFDDYGDVDLVDINDFLVVYIGP